MKSLRTIAVISALALGLRALAAWWIGPGVFGPDGSGATAAVTLGGHPYPLHPLLIGLFGGARVLSVIAGAATAAAAAVMGRRLGGGLWGPGLAAACAPLLVYPAATAGGDAPAIALMTGGIALAWSGRPGLGGLLAGLSVAVKPIALPLAPLLLVTPALTASPAAAALALVMVALGAGLGVLPWLETLDPLLRPRPRGGLLGTWWMGTGGAPPALSDWPGAIAAGTRRLWEIPWWAGHPILGGAAAIGALLPGPERRARMLAAALGVGGLLAVAVLIGDRMDPRYVGAPSVVLTVLAGCALRRVPWLTLALAWPALGVSSQVAAVRGHEEALPVKPTVPFPRVEAERLFMDGGVCGGGELRAMAADLAGRLPQGAEVAMVRLRDGREAELYWPLQAARPDLKLTVIHAGCCGGDGCVERLLGFDAPATVLPGDSVGCLTETLDYNEAQLFTGYFWGDPGQRFVLREGAGGWPGDACGAMR